MATDSTELTFVRCPSCRSLVPAISTRCRMCGATIDASSKPDAAERDLKQASRVRQRTMSQPDNELSAVAGKLRQEAVEPEPLEAVEPAPEPAPVMEVPEPTVAATRAAEVSASDDPLRAFMAGGEEALAPSAATEDFTVSDEVEEPVAPPPKPVVAAPVVPAARPQPTLVSPEPAMERPVAREGSKPQPTSSELIVESGARGARSSGLQFGKPAEKPATPERPSREPRPREGEGSPRGMQPRAHHEGPKGDAGAGRGPERSDRSPEQGRGRGDEARRHQEAPRDRSREEQSQPKERGNRSERPQRPAESEAVASDLSGRLFGWLVSYRTPEGRATELREGKFFVSRRKTKSQDIIIDEEGIGSPHAMCKVSAEGGFVVQDMLSDRGVFLRRRGSDVYRREEEAVKVEHGDWLRIGDVEFLVSLVAHVGEM